MSNAEQWVGGIDRASAVDFVRPAGGGGEMPLVRVIESGATGDVTAQFALRLSGVSYSGSVLDGTNKLDAERYGSMRYVASLLDGLRGSQTIEVVCIISRQGGRGLQNEFKIIGTAEKRRREDSIEETVSLFESVNVVLKTMKSEYQFAMIDAREGFEDDAGGCLWSAVIEPATSTIFEKDRRSIGFVTQRQGVRGQTSIVLPTLPGKRIHDYLDSLYCGASGRSKSLRLALRVSPVRLDAAQQASVERMVKGLKEGHRIVCKTESGQEEDLESQAQIAKVIASLDPWVRDPCGYRISCRVNSDRALPASLLSMIGKEVFGDCRLSSQYTGPAGQKGSGARELESESVATVDLGGCLHKTSAHAPLFPSARVLSEAGFKREYSGGIPAFASEGILLGRCGTDLRAESVFYPRDDRAKHCYIIGASGTGKSTLLYNMIMQDIVNGEGVTLIDPHGDLYTDVLGSIPKDRLGDVVLVNPCDFEYATGINFLETSNSAYRSVEMNFIINEMMCIFDRLYDLRTTGGPIFEQYMRNALGLIMDADPEGGTLMDVPVVFEDDSFRKKLLAKCRNVIIKNFWKKQALKAGGDAALANIAPYITSKLNQFTTNALLRPIIGQPKSTINFRTILDEGKILLVNLSKGLLGQLDTMLLGMLIIGKIFSSAMSRVSIPKEQRRQMFLYVDEFQNFTTESVAHLLSESRKFGIALTLANQNLGQLSSGHARHNILDSVLGNVGTMLMFRMGILDADRMAPYARPAYRAQDLQELPDYHVISRMLAHNVPQRPFVFNTLPVGPKNTSRDLQEIIDHLRRRYSTPTYEVESQIIARYSLGEE